jgi:hypothetical protein
VPPPLLPSQSAHSADAHPSDTVTQDVPLEAPVQILPDNDVTQDQPLGLSMQTSPIDTVTPDQPFDISAQAPSNASVREPPRNTTTTSSPPPLSVVPPDNATPIGNVVQQDAEARRLETIARRQPYLDYYEDLIGIVTPGTAEYPELIYGCFATDRTMSSTEEDEHIHSVCLSLFGGGFDIWEMHGVYRSEFFWIIHDFILNRAHESDTLAMAWLGLFIQRILDGMEVHEAWELVS